MAQQQPTRAQIQAQTANNRKVARELTAIFTAALGAGAIFTLGWGNAYLVASLLEHLRPAPSEKAAWWVSQLITEGNLPGPMGVPGGPAQDIERLQSAAWLALYCVAAAERLAGAGEDQKALDAAEANERRYWALHLAAEERRMRAAAGQDMAALLNVDRTKETKGLLGWRAILDARTTPECRDAAGKNFKADRMPIIGWPGSVHIGCRCSAGPPVPGAPMLPSA